MAKRASPKPRSASLSDRDAIATIAVKDLKKARRFYEDVLGFPVADARDDQVVTYSSGDAQFFVYVSPFAGTNRATAATWLVEDVDSLAKGLKAKGVGFERYDMPGMTREGDVHVAGEMRAAWFRDPDGNILAIVSG